MEICFGDFFLLARRRQAGEQRQVGEKKNNKDRPVRERRPRSIFSRRQPAASSRNGIDLTRSIGQTTHRRRTVTPSGPSIAGHRATTPVSAAVGDAHTHGRSSDNSTYSIERLELHVVERWHIHHGTLEQDRGGLAGHPRFSLAASRQSKQTARCRLSITIALIRETFIGHGISGERARAPGILFGESCTTRVFSGAHTRRRAR